MYQKVKQTHKTTIAMKSIIELVAGLLVWSIIIMACAFDPNQLLRWLEIECFLILATIGWWKVFNLPNPFKEDKNDNEKV